MSFKDIEEVGGACPFGPGTEKSIISLAFDNPEFFSTVGRFLSHKFFRMVETKYVMGIIENMFEDTGYVPTREVVRDEVLKELTADDDYEPILEIVDRPLNRRELPFVKKELMKWAQNRAFGMLYDDEGMTAYENHDYDKLESIFEEARKITDVTTNGLNFFEGFDCLFERSNRNVYTCGFPKLDRVIEGNGPAKGEVFCWMAPTGVGKCHTLSSKIWEKRLSRIYEIEIEKSGSTKKIKIAGFRRVKTKRGEIMVCNLTEEDYIIEIPIIQDKGDLSL